MKRLVQGVDANPLVIGHRGACGYLPEHTLASYRMAIEMGVDFIEPDLVLSRDHRLIARHDNELSLTTDVAQRREFRHRFTTKLVDGVQRKGWFCEDFELSEIKALRVLHNHPARHGSQDMDEGELGVACFEEIIALVREVEARRGLRIGIYPETKIPTYYAHEGSYLDGSPIRQSIGRLLVEALMREEFTAPDRVFIQSFEIENLIELHDRIMPSKGLRLPLIQLFGDIKGNLKLPEGDFSMSYDFVYHHHRGDDLGRLYPDLVGIAGVESRPGYQALASTAALDWMADRYAGGIGLWIGNLLAESAKAAGNANNSSMTASAGSDNSEATPSLIHTARQRGLHVHAYPLCDRSALSHPVQGDWREREMEEAIVLFNQGVDGLFCNLPDIGVEAKRRFMLHGNRPQ
jgi:glycerophosphoryl diester phosphodiesterase